MPAAVDRSADAVTIVVPVYGALAETLACIRSVLVAKRRTPAHLVVIDDCSPDERVFPALLEASAGGERFTLERNTRNRGFVSTANRGMLAAAGDVVLLNSDTLVTDGWLDRLVAWAQLDEAVASVCPMTNNATILSYPKMNVANPLPGDVDLGELAELFAATGRRSATVTVPVGVGFCMLLTRRAIEAVGAFDEALFGIGYGEECDWCMRAGDLGFKHVVATDTFVYHEGSVSFSDRAAKRQELAARSLAMRHPRYWPLIGQFCAGDPLLPARRAVDVRRLERAAAWQKGVVLHVLHRLGGGTRVHAQALAGLLRAEGVASIFAVPDEVGRLTLAANFLDGLDNLVFNCADDLPLLRQLFAALPLLRCHVHALIGFSGEATAFLRGIAAPRTVTLHDYAFICPQITLLDETGSHCSLPSHTRCNSCLAKKPPPLPCSDIGGWRRDWRGFLEEADRVVAPSRFVQATFQRLHPGLPIHVVPHDAGVARMLPTSEPRRVAPDRTGRRQIAVFGNMNHHKGLQVVLDCAAKAREDDLPLQFLLFGQACGEEEEFGGRLRWMGAYRHAELPAMLDACDCEIALLPSIWPETFSYVLSEIVELGLHPVVFDLGAQAERLRALGLGTILPPGLSAATLNAALLGIEPARPGAGAADGRAREGGFGGARYLDRLYGEGWDGPSRAEAAGEDALPAGDRAA